MLLKRRGRFFYQIFKERVVSFHVAMTIPYLYTFVHMRFGQRAISMRHRSLDTRESVNVIANAELREPRWRYNSKTLLVWDPNWYFKSDMKSRFGWWLHISVPHWFLTTIFAIAATAPWIRWSKRFSLRTLLLLTTLVAVVLGLVVAIK